MTTLRIACVGAGSGPGARTHGYLSVIKKLSHLYDLCAVADVVEDNARAAAQQFDIPAVYSDLETMLTEEKPDVVLRMAPTDAAVSVCVTAAEHGCHVINEIPIAITLPMADLIIRACQDNGVHLEIAENVWLWPHEQLKQRIVAQGLIGQPVHCRLKYPCGSYHGFNAIRMILQKDPVRVLGYGGTVPVMPLPAYGGGMMTSSQWEAAVLDFGDGLHCLFEMPPKKPVWERNWDIVGTHGYITGETLVLFRQGHHHGGGEEERFPIEEVYEEREGTRVLTQVRVNTDPPVAWDNPYAPYGVSDTDDVAKAAILESMYRAVMDGAPLRYGAANGRRDQELCIAIKESAWRDSQWIDLPLTQVTSVEEALHEAFRRRYGMGPLEDIPRQLRAHFTRESVMWTVAGWL